MKKIDIMHAKRRVMAFFHPFGVIGICLLLIVMCILLYHFNPFSFSGDVKLAITTGVSASALVTMFAEMIHNNRRNLVRVFALEEYYSALFDFSLLRDSQIKLFYSKDEDEVWADALEEVAKDNDVKGVTPAHIRYLLFNFKSIITICETCKGHAELLTYTESSIVKDIRIAMDRIKWMLTSQLRDAEFDHDSSLRCIEDLHDLFDGLDAESSNQDCYRRLKQVFKMFGVESLPELCSKITSIETVMEVREAVDQAFEGYDLIEEKHQGVGEERISDTLDSGEYENPAIRFFKKKKEIETRFQRTEIDVHEYLADFLQNPKYISEKNRSLVALYLVQIHKAMMKLEKKVSREPFHGELIEFAKSRSFRKPVKGLLRLDEENDD